MSISKRLASIFTVAALAGGITYSGASYVKYIVDTDSPTFIAKGIELFMISAVSIFGGIGGNYIYNALTGRKEDEPELDEQSPVI
jgi:hypothetical protein